MDCNLLLILFSICLNQLAHSADSLGGSQSTNLSSTLGISRCIFALHILLGFTFLCRIILFLPQSNHSWINQCRFLRNDARVFCRLQSANSFTFRKLLKSSTIHHGQHYNITMNVSQFL